LTLAVEYHPAIQSAPAPVAPSAWLNANGVRDALDDVAQPDVLIASDEAGKTHSVSGFDVIALGLFFGGAAAHDPLREAKAR
jgi:hypothetical protein